MANEERDVCSKGKSCKTACIKKGLVCREDLKSSVQSGLSQLVETLKGAAQNVIPQPRPKPTDPASQLIEKGMEFAKEFKGRIESLEGRIGALRRDNANIEARIRGSRMSSDERGKLRAQLSRNLQVLNLANQELVSVMGGIRQKMLDNSKLTQEQIDKLVGGIDIIKGGKNGKEIKGQLAEFARMFGGKGFSNVRETPGMGVSPLTSIFYSKERAWADVEMGHMRLDGRKGTTFHEMGHYIEYQRPWLQKFMNKWRNERAWDRATVKEMYGMEDVPPPIVSTLRTGGRRLPVIPMSYLTGGTSYARDEVGVADEFLSPYMGKIYRDGGTEVLSMGIEQFSSPQRMATLRRAHPELFHLVVGLSQD